MNTAWPLGVGALVLEGLALAPLWEAFGGGGQAEMGLALHLSACLVFALAFSRVFPVGHPYRGWETGGLAFVLALVLPALGMLGTLALLVPAFWRRPPPIPAAGWLRTGVPDLPSAQPPSQLAETSRGPRNLQAILLNAPVRNMRLAALRETLKLPDARAASLLRRALRDTDEEVRLLAHALLSRKEKAVESQIHRLQQAIVQRGVDSDFALHKGLAYSYWQMALLGQSGRAASSAVLTYANDHARLALALRPGDAGLLLLLCQISLGLEDTDAVDSAYASLVQVGLPEKHLRPYLAEMEFKQHRSCLDQTKDESDTLTGPEVPLSDAVRTYKGERYAIASVLR
jgi:hypothetical protein